MRKESCYDKKKALQYKFNQQVPRRAVEAHTMDALARKVYGISRHSCDSSQLQLLCTVKQGPPQLKCVPVKVPAVRRLKKKRVCYLIGSQGEIPVFLPMLRSAYNQDDVLVTQDFGQQLLL